MGLNSTLPSWWSWQVWCHKINTDTQELFLTLQSISTSKVFLLSLLYVLISLIPSKAVSYTQIKSYVQSPEMLVMEAFPNDPMMVSIAHCESSMRQFYASSTKVIRSTTSDSGLFQINDLWIPKSKELGLDISTIEGNIAMAKYIKDVQGYKAWACYDIVLQKKK